MAHYHSPTLTRPTHFNFATDVVDYWAHQDPPLQAMHWVSSDGSRESKMSYRHFSRQSHRIATMLRREEALGIKRGDVCIMILPRIPEW